jgi:hypothetical protein
METEYDFSQGERGAIDPKLPGKIRIAIWLDDEVLAWFREQVHLAGRCTQNLFCIRSKASIAIAIIIVKAKLDENW